MSGFWLGSYDPEREEWMGGGESRTLVNESQEALMSNDLVDIGLLGWWPSWPHWNPGASITLPSGACGASWQGSTLVLSLQPENTFDFTSKDLFVHSTRRLQASVLMIR